jgi:glycine/D-amino acid oxidase-like deaminating enzyme
METHRWSGQVLDTVDYAGFIGRDPVGKNIYVAMGDSGQGLTHGVMGAMLNTGLIRQGSSMEGYLRTRPRPAEGGEEFLDGKCHCAEELCRTGLGSDDPARRF